MKALSYFVLVFGVCVSANAAFGFPFKSNKDENSTTTVGNAGNAGNPGNPGSAVGNAAPRESKINVFGNDDIFAMGKDFMKKAQMKIAQLEESVMENFKRHSSAFDPNVQTMQNSSSKDIKKPDLLTNEDEIPSEVNNNIDDSEIVVRDLSRDTEVNDSLWKQQKASGLVSLHPDIEIINLENIPQAKYYYTSNHIDEASPKDLSRDTLINDRTSQQQASSGMVAIDPDSELIDVKQHEQVPSQTHTVESLQTDPDTEIVEAPNGIDQVPAADLSRDTVVNQRAAEEVASGLRTMEPDAEYIDGYGSKNYVPNTIQQAPLRDLSRDTAINDRVAEQQAASGLVMIDPDAELIDDKKIATPTNKNYYRVQNSPQDRSYRDLTSDVRINDLISKKQQESGLVMIDPDAELINANAYQQYPTYYYVPNHIEQVARRKRVPPTRYQIYERRMVRPRPQVVYYEW